MKSNLGKATRKAAKERGTSGGIFGPHTMVAQTKERERSLTITFSIIFISFIICFLPLCLLTVFDPMPPSKLGWLHMIANILGWTSSFINPIIYCATNKVRHLCVITIFIKCCFSTILRHLHKHFIICVDRNDTELFLMLLKKQLAKILRNHFWRSRELALERSPAFRAVGWKE